MEKQRKRTLSGIGFMVLGVTSFAAMDAVGKWLVRDVPIFQLLAVRSTLVTMALAFFLPLAGGRKGVQTRQMGAHVVRSLCGIAAFLFFFTSVRYLPLADAVAVAFGGPFIVTALSVPLLREHVDGRRWAAIGLGFVGMLLVVQPTGEGFRPAALLVIASSVSYALMMILTRWMAERGPAERAYAFVLYNFVVQAAVGWLGVPWGWVALSPFDWVLVASMGALALSGHFGITLAFQRAPVSVVAPFEYTALVWATVLGFVVFGDFPSAAVWFGVLVIVVSGLYSIYHENP